MIKLYSYPSNQGVNTGGQPQAPSILTSLLKQLGHELNVPVAIGATFDPPHPIPNSALERIAAYGQTPVAAVANTVLMGLGGDHSIAFSHASVCGLRGNVGCLWVDAHGDFNDPESSPSGNGHGMVLAALCGAIPGFQRMIDPNRSVIWGARSLDAGEGERLAYYGVRTVAPSTAETVLRALDRMLPEHLYLSLDVDAMDPAHAPATGTPVAGGFDPDDLGRSLCKLLGTRKLAGLDLVEFDPAKPGAERTLESIRRLLTHILPVIHSGCAAVENGAGHP